MSCGNSVLVTDSPPEASGFPLADGQTRTFVFKVRGHRWGPATLNVHVIAETASGATIDESGSAVVDVQTGSLRRGGEPVEPATGGHFCSAAFPPR
jgi:hypothetical protein